MNMTTPRLGRRAIAVAGAVALGVVGLGFPAFADGETPAYGNIDSTKPVSLTIHKHVKVSTGTQARPDGSTNLTQDAVEGVVFTAYKIDLDLTLQASWKTLDDYAKAHPQLAQSVCTNKQLPAGLTLANPEVKKDFNPTTPEGVAKADLDQGAYLICETNTTNAKVKGAPVKIVDAAAPFITTLPFPDMTGAGATKGWLYNVHAYPKNTPAKAPVKGQDTGSNMGIQVGEQLTYTVDALIPDIDDATENFKYFNIYDQLAKETSDIAIKSVQIGDPDAQGKFSNGADVPSGKYTKTINQNGRFAQVDFNTVEGLQYLEANPNKIIRMTVTAKVNEVPADGNLRNTGNFLVDTETLPPNTPPDTPPTPPNTPPVTPPDDPDTPPTTPPENPPTPSNTTVSNWGNLIIQKQDSGDNSALNGAKFKVVEPKEKIQGGVPVFPESCAGLEADPNKVVTINGATEFESKKVGATNGIITIPGLFIDSKIGATNDPTLVPEHEKRCYFLIETAAPAGYTLDATPKPFVVEAGKTAAEMFGTNTISNTKHDVPQLPLTGANGQLLLTVGGVALLLLAVGGTLVVRRRREN